MNSISAITGTNPAAASSEAGQKLNADFDMFLKLLTTQMQNQDPLDPMDTSEYTQQLVQYSQVEQSMQQTATLKDILANLTTQDMAQSAGFLGKRAEFDTAIAGLTADAPAQWGWRSDRDVTTITATVSDAGGRVIETRMLDANREGEFAWDGRTASGTMAKPGNYSLSLRALDGSGNEVPLTVRSMGTVDEVSTVDGSVQLGVNGAIMPAATLLRIKN